MQPLTRTGLTTMRLRDVLTEFDRALVRAGHPLADPDNRANGRPAEETRRAGRELLGRELPDELVELWSWWSGPDDWPRRLELDSLSEQFPGGPEVLSLEGAIETRGRLDWSEVLIPPADKDWLPVLAMRQRMDHFWVDISGDPSKPVDVWLYEMPDEFPGDPGKHKYHWKSIAPVFEDMIELLDTKLWRYYEHKLSDGSSIAPFWQYTGENDRYPWM